MELQVNFYTHLYESKNILRELPELPELPELREISFPTCQPLMY